MFARKLFAASLVISSMLSLSLAASPASAQTSAGCTSVAYFSPVVAFLGATSAIDYTKLDSVGSAFLTAVNLRNQYEDVTPPAGCESVKPVVIQILSLREDIIYLQSVAKIDAANAKDYKDLALNFGAVRFQAVGKVFNDAVANITFPDTLATALPVATAAAGATVTPPQVCPDAKFGTQLKADQASLSQMSAVNIIAAIKLRYVYEDLKAPSGCADAQTLVIQDLANIEDQTGADVLGQVDASNAATFTKFSTDTYVPRAATITGLLTKAVPALALAATPSK